MVQSIFLIVSVCTLTSVTHLVKGLSLDSAAVAKQAHVQRKKTNLADIWRKIGDGECSCTGVHPEIYNRVYEGKSSYTVEEVKNICMQNTWCSGITWADYGYDMIVGTATGAPAYSAGTGTLPCGFGPPTNFFPRTVNGQSLECWSRTSGEDDPQATGDPHLQNVHGQRFDLMKPGKHVLINIPRGARAEKALLRAEAEAFRMGGSCADMYFQTINITGLWAEAKQAGGYHFDSQSGAKGSPEWFTLDKVTVKIAYGRTQAGIQYLNFYVKHMGRVGFAIGGLLGEDDHQDVTTPPAGCLKEVSLSASMSANSSSATSVAIAVVA